ncbi:MAG: hypothetical protein GX414_12585 [Acidobacteria bacterium]|nr:hypothetical protein [Acidobacteriota bacterium]
MRRCVVSIIGLAALWVAAGAVRAEAPLPAETIPYADSVSLAEYVRLLDEMQVFQQRIRAADFDGAAALARAVAERVPELSPGHEMGFLAAALGGRPDAAVACLERLAESYFIYPEIYANLLPVVERLADPAQRQRLREAVAECFQRRAFRLHHALVRGANGRQILVEMMYLHHAAGDEAGALRSLEAVAVFDGPFARNFLRRSTWRDPAAARAVEERLDAKRRAWSGAVEERMDGVVRVAAAVQAMSAALPLTPVTDWPGHVARWIPAALAATDKAAYYEALAGMVHALGDNHTRVLFPDDVAAACGDCGLGIRPVGERFLVERVDDPALTDRVRPGDEITAVDGRAPAEHLARNSWRFPWVEHAALRPAGYARRRLAADLLAGPAGTMVQVTVRTPDSTTAALTLRRDRPLRCAPAAPDEPLVTAREVAPGVWRIRIPRFEGGDVYAAFREAIAPIDPDRTRGLILDLRDNPGGNSAYGDAIFAHFIDTPCPSYRLDYTPVFAPTKINGHHGRLRLYSEGPSIQPAAGPRFGCPVVLLVSELTASAAEDFVCLFRDQGRALLVGRPTAGGTGNGHYVDLPGGGMLRVGLNVSLAYSWRGLKPDVSLEPSPADLAAGRDAELARALELLPAAAPAGP